MLRINTQRHSSPRFPILAAPIICMFLMSALPFSGFCSEHVTAEHALALLKAGNARYIADTPSKKDYRAERAASAEHQSPYAVIIACADSRVAPEILFDESLGKIFVIRVAGNVIDSVVVGSVEYAVANLLTPLVVILGHESCGAVHAAVYGEPVTPGIESIVNRIDPTIVGIGNGHHSAKIEHAAQDNVVYQITQLVRESATIRSMIKKHTLQVVGAEANLHTGIVAFIP